jgi:hypothetical protein
VPEGLSTKFKVGRFRCSITLPIESLTAGTAKIQTRWEPGIPKRLTEAELLEYRRGRDALLVEAARILGGPVIVAEV